MNLKQILMPNTMHDFNQVQYLGYFKIVFGAALISCLVSGCSSRIDNVTSEMKKIHDEPTLPIPPAPVFLPVPTFTYAAQGLRSPFLPSSLAEELKVMAGKHVMPDLSRPPQFLEQFPLESLHILRVLCLHLLRIQMVVLCESKLEITSERAMDALSVSHQRRLTWLKLFLMVRKALLRDRAVWSWPIQTNNKF
jgi:hypothetical protein